MCPDSRRSLMPKRARMDNNAATEEAVRLGGLRNRDVAPGRSATYACLVPLTSQLSSWMPTRGN